MDYGKRTLDGMLGWAILCVLGPSALLVDTESCAAAAKICPVFTALNDNVPGLPSIF